MIKRKGIRVGDVFAIPIDNERYSYGQIIAKGYGSDCYVIFDIVANEHPLLEQIPNNKVVFLTFTLHQKIAEGEWALLGNAPVNGDVRIPEFKVDVIENGVVRCMVSRYDGEILRYATEHDVKSLSTMQSYTPNVLESAVKAKYGIIPWRPYFDELIYKG